MKMKKVFFAFVAFSAIAGMAMISCSAKAPKSNLKTEADSLSYAWGVVVTQGLDAYMAQNGIDSTQMKDFVAGLLEGVKIDKEDKKAAARQFGMGIAKMINDNMYPGVQREAYGDDTTKKIDKDLFVAGFIAAATNKDMKLDKEFAATYSREKADAIKEAAMEEEFKDVKAENLKFLEENKSKEGVVTTASGLQYKVITEGTGPKPAATDRVKVNYAGTTINGEEFDSSYKRNEPAVFGVNQVIKGWTEGLQLMPVGSKYQFFIPYNLAYGPQGQGGKIGPFATLVFEVELLSIEQ